MLAEGKGESGRAGDPLAYKNANEMIYCHSGIFGQHSITAQKSPESYKAHGKTKRAFLHFIVTRQKLFEILMCNVFGASGTTSSFSVGFKVPNTQKRAFSRSRGPGRCKRALGWGTGPMGTKFPQHLLANREKDVNVTGNFVLHVNFVTFTSALHLFTFLL